MVFVAHYIGTITVAIIFAQNLSLFGGACWLFKFIGEDITKDVTAFNTAAQTSDGKQAALKRFCDLVKIYSDAKQ